MNDARKAYRECELSLSPYPWRKILHYLLKEVWVGTTDISDLWLSEKS